MSTAEGPILVKTGDGLTIRYHGRNLYSPVSPITSAERRVLATPIAPETLVFVPSPLLFYGIDRILHDPQTNVHFLCVEADQALMQMSLSRSSEVVLQNQSLTYLRTESVDEVLKALHRVGIQRFKRAHELVINGGRSLNPGLYSSMFRAVEYEIQSHWRNRVTLMHMAHLWVKNFFLNIPTFVVGGDVSTLDVGRPIVVTGAGESLEAAIPTLQPLRDRYFLLSVDTAVRSLSDSGLSPDGVVVLDAQWANLLDLIGFDTAQTTLFSDVTAYPGAVRRFEGERWFFFSKFASLGLFTRARAAGLLPVALPPLGSVGVAALYCAMTITSAPVLFAGIDFSYRPGKSHARGAPAHLIGLLAGGRLSPISAFGRSVDRQHRVAIDKQGRKVWTDNLMEAYNAALGLLVGGNRRVYDLGETGLATPAPVLTRPESIAQVLPESRRRTGDPTAGNRAWSKEEESGRIAAAVEFLQAERTRLADGIHLAIRAIRLGSNTDASLQRAISALDFVYAHFPDWSTEPRLSEGFLKRFVEAAETSATWIDRGLSELRAPRS